MSASETVAGRIDESFAAYLARYLRAKRGFHTTVPPDAEALVPACDLVLVRAIQNVVSVACIVDRDARPDARFGLSPRDAAAVVRRCVDARGGTGKRRRLVSLTIYEVGGEVAISGAERRLEEYRIERTFGRLPVVQLVLVDPWRGLVLDNARRVFGRAFAFGWLRKLVTEPRLTPMDLAPPSIAGDVGRTPVLTIALLVALATVFTAETLFPVEPWTGTLHATVRTLLAFGGVDHALVVDEGQWWRMVTAPLLHADAFHILFNGLALWLIGRLSERLMGVAWFAATFTVSALGGSALSIAVNPSNLLSVGASGAIVGLFLATFTLSFHFTTGDMRSRLQGRTLGTLVPALVPILSGAHGAAIDYGAHFGGAAAGLAMGLAMLALWPKALPRPRFARFAGGVALGGLALCAASLPPGIINYRKQPLYAELFQPWPTTEAEARARAYDIVTAKPRDPRGHFVQGLALIDAKDLPGAEEELRKAVSDPDMLGLLAPRYENRIRLVLGAVLRDEKKSDAAEVVLAPACAAEKAGGPMSADIARLKLCP